MGSNPTTSTQAVNQGGLHRDALFRESAVARVESIVCAECGRGLSQTRRWQQFCSAEHRTSYHRAQKDRGRIAAPFLAVWARSRDIRDRDLRAYARKQLTAMEAVWRGQDRRTGRRPDLIVAAKMAEGWSAVDLEKRPAKAPRRAQGDLPTNRTTNGDACGKRYPDFQRAQFDRVKRGDDCVGQSLPTAANDNARSHRHES